jgi:hypothetical protein
MPKKLTDEERAARESERARQRTIAERTRLHDALLRGVDSGKIDKALATHASTLAKLQIADGEDVDPFGALRIAEHTVGELSRRADQRWSDERQITSVDVWMHAYAAVHGWQYEPPTLSADELLLFWRERFGQYARVRWSTPSSDALNPFLEARVKVYEVVTTYSGVRLIGWIPEHESIFNVAPHSVVDVLPVD